MTTQTELLREALDAANMYTHYMELEHAALVSAARSALAQPEQPAPQGAELAALMKALRGNDLHYSYQSRLAELLAASPTPPQAEQAEAEKPKTDGKLLFNPGPDARAVTYRTMANEAAKPETERARFETWIAKDGGDLSTFGSGQNIHYKNSAVNNAWIGWKTRAALLSADSKDAGEPVAVPQFRKPYSANWYDGHPDQHDGGGPYETRVLYATRPQAAEAQPQPLTDEFARLYWAACESSQPRDWFRAALAAQRVLKTKNPASITGKDNAS